MDKQNFNHHAKTEILEKACGEKCCKIAWLAAAVKAIGSLNLLKKGAVLVFEGSNYEYIKTIVDYVKSLYFCTLDVETKNVNGGLKKGRWYKVKLPPLHSRTLLTDTEIIGGDEEGAFVFNNGVGRNVIAKECCAKSFLASLFVATGAANVPEKIIGATDEIESSGNGYYLEFLLADEQLAEDIIKILAQFSIAAKSTERNGKTVVYVKDSDAISNFFALMEASDTVLYMQDIIVERLLNNNLNRQNNCEVGNYDKIAIASAKQIMAINRIADTVGLEKLPDSLRGLARLRLENPTATLEWLAEKSGGISKSGINHRFRKIIEISENCGNNENV